MSIRTSSIARCITKGVLSSSCYRWSRWACFSGSCGSAKPSRRRPRARTRH